MQQAYLQLLDPAAIPSLFKSSLTPALLGETALCVLKSTAAHGEDLSRWLQLLDSFAATPRFGMVKLAMPAATMKELSAAWEAAEAAVAGTRNADQLAAIKSAYGL